MLMIRGVRPVPLGPSEAAVDRPVDLLLADGRVAAVGPTLELPPGCEEHDGEGRWVVPGLWDHHVHLGQWAELVTRLDLAGTGSVEEAVERLAPWLADHPGVPVVGFGHRPAQWPRRPRVVDLDEVAPATPVILISGDAHHGWLNSAAMAALGVPWRDDVVREAEWFAAYERLSAVVGDAGSSPAAYRLVQEEAAQRGVVGLVDFEFTGTAADWSDRLAAGAGLLRVRVATYAGGLPVVLAQGLRTGDVLPGCDGRITMGPLKIISDGSLNTRTAWCCSPYADGDQLDHPAGLPNLPAAELTGLLRDAHAGGLEIAVHAIGDAAVRQALDAFEETAASGSVEHAQLVDLADVPRMVSLGVRASVQPAHLLDDRDVSEQCWPDRGHRSFALRSMLDAGVDMRMGSDAPVAPLDPWLAMAAAVHRSADEREPWHPEQALTAREALACSTDGWGTVAVGHPADLALLDDDPLAVAPDSAAAGEHLRSVRVAATYVDGERIFVR